MIEHRKSRSHCLNSRTESCLIEFDKTLNQAIDPDASQVCVTLASAVSIENEKTYKPVTQLTQESRLFFRQTAKGGDRETRDEWVVL